MITFLSLLLLRFNFSCFCIFPSAFFIATMALPVVERVRVYQCHYCCNNVTVDGTACQFSGDYKGVARPCEMEEVLWWKGNMCIGSGNNCCSTCFAGCGEKKQRRQHNRATNEFWKRKQQICAGCTATHNGPPVIACEAVAPAASSHEVQWHAAAVAADPAVTVPPPPPDSSWLPIIARPSLQDGSSLPACLASAPRS